MNKENPQEIFFYIFHRVLSNVDEHATTSIVKTVLWPVSSSNSAERLAPEPPVTSFIASMPLNDGIW
jgi:hypothetical protein